MEGGWTDRDVTKLGERNGKPVMVVLLEHFHSSHSIYRTHSTSMIAARERFYLIGVGNDAVDEAGKAVFDEFHVLEGNNVVFKLDHLKAICEKNGAAVFLYAEYWDGFNGYFCKQYSPCTGSSDCFRSPCYDTF